MGRRRMLGVQDRAAIMAGLEAGLSQAHIARLIGRCPSVVCREIAAMRALMGRIEPRSPSCVRARTRTGRNLQSWSSKLKRACQISHGAGAASLAVIPVSRELCDAV